ncbi:4227_t:CDS:2, partial [Dentiscutata erythropus]
TSPEVESGENEEYEDEDNVIDLRRSCSKTIDQAKELQSEEEILDASTLSTIQYMIYFAVIELQLSALYGQIIGVDLLDNGLYFGFEGHC